MSSNEPTDNAAHPEASGTPSQEIVPPSATGSDRAKERKSISVEDILRSSKNGEQEMETRLLKSIETVDLHEGDQFMNFEQSRLMADIAADEIAKAQEEQEQRAALRNSQRFGNEEEEGTTAAESLKPPPKKSALKRLYFQSRLSTEGDSVEHKLFGLTTTLGRMVSNKRVFGASIRKKDIAGDYTQTSADRLDKTAKILVGGIHDTFKGKNKDKGGDVEAPSLSFDQEESQTQSSQRGSERPQSQTKQKTCPRFKPGAIKDEWSIFSGFLSPRKASAKRYARNIAVYIMLPSLALSFLFYHAFDNPHVEGNPTKPSYSWLFLFLGVRHVITGTMAVATQVFLIDYLALSTRIILRWGGPFFTLFLTQSKGWPFLFVFWGLYSYALLAGDRDYARHWLFWQDWLGIFNEKNPSGNVVNSENNYRVLALAVICGLLVTVKRMAVAIFLGRQSFVHYGEQLVHVMSKIVAVGEVATLAQVIERRSDQFMTTSGVSQTILGLVTEQNDEEEENRKSKRANVAEAASAAVAALTLTAAEKSDRRGIGEGGGGGDDDDDEYTEEEQAKISELLGAWEEPQTSKEKHAKGVSIGAVLQFRQALTFMNVRYPFLPVFGRADTRERCIQSAQKVYQRLLLRTPDCEALPFETLALLAKDDKGNFDERKAKEMIRLFRPDRNGNLSEIDFVRSIDAIYKSIRLVSANISNSSQIDHAVESLANFAFYFVLGFWVASEFGLEPLRIFFSFSSIVIAFAFMFGSASAKYFEGMLFIILQRPYGVGDRIHLSSPENETNIDGSAGWIVEKVTMYTTYLYWGATNERASIANGAISNLRVINAARSPNAQVYINLKFAVDTEFEKIEIFKAAVETFLKDRPREWLAFNGFRPTEVAVDQGYIAYVIIALSRSSWQEIGAVLTTKAELVNFCLELSKQLGLRYESPPLPVDLSINEPSSGELSPKDIRKLASAKTL